MGTADTDGRLVRAIGRGDLTAAVVNGVIGSAVFGLPSSQAALTGAWSPPSASIADGGRLDLLAHFAPRRGRRFWDRVRGLNRDGGRRTMFPS